MDKEMENKLENLALVERFIKEYDLEKYPSLCFIVYKIGKDALKNGFKLSDKKKDWDNFCNWMKRCLEKELQNILKKEHQ